MVSTVPIVSASVSSTAINEGDLFTVTFDVDGEIPEGGLEIFVDTGVPAGLLEFTDVGGGVTLNNIDPSGTPDSDLSGISLTLLAADASISLPVSSDGTDEGEEPLSLTIVDGDDYDVAPNASSVVLTISDPEPQVIDGTPGDDVLEGGFGNDTIFGDRKSTRLNSSHPSRSRMPSSA